MKLYLFTVFYENHGQAFHKVAVKCYLVITSVANQYDEHFKKFHFFLSC